MPRHWTVLVCPTCPIVWHVWMHQSVARTAKADFLVCADGKWGILEVDGEPFHPPSRTVADHDRDRVFRLHGVRVVEHFEASECFNNPDQVVAKFLELLRKS